MWQIRTFFQFVTEISTYRCLVKVVEKLIFHMIEALNPYNVLVALFQCYNFEILAFYFFLTIAQIFFVLYFLFYNCLIQSTKLILIFCGRHKTVEFGWKNTNVRDAWKISIYTVLKIMGVVSLFVFQYHKISEISVFLCVISSERATNNREKQGLKNPIKRV